MALQSNVLLIMTFACMSLQAIKSQGPDNESRVHENLKNFFDSIYRKDVQRSDVLHGVLKHEVEGEQFAFHALRKELQWETRSKHADYRIVSKREVHKNGDGTTSVTENHGTKGGDDGNAEEKRKSMELEFDKLLEEARSYDNFLRRVEQYLEDEGSQSDAHLDDESVYYDFYILTTAEDQKRRYKRANYVYRIGILDEVRKARAEGPPHYAPEWEKKRAIIDDASTEQKESLTDKINLLQDAIPEFKAIISALRVDLSRELVDAQRGTTVHTWCTAGSCEYGDEPYTFRDDHHENWIEETLKEIEELLPSDKNDDDYD